MDLNCFDYTTNSAIESDIEMHLNNCSFHPPLNNYVDIAEYSKKIRNNAFTFECWSENKLIGLIACYLNDKNTQKGFITNVSVVESYKHIGIATNLLKRTINEAKKNGFKSIELEVEANNTNAISLYKKHGFEINGEKQSKLLMINHLDEVCLVSVCCLAYNHEEFISKTLDSFLAQKVNFNFEILVHDDASSDRTADIIRQYEIRYPDKIKAIYQKENQFVKGLKLSSTYQFPRAQGKYIALCEGDDYWIHPYKLQQQVDFMESNPEFTFCVGGYKSIDMSTGYRTEVNIKRKISYNGKGFTFTLDDMLDTWMTKTLTALFRKTILDDLNTSPYKSFRDIGLFYHLAKRGKGFYFNEIFGVYRVHPGGINSMKKGQVNNNASYNCYKELYENNKDEFTRIMYRRSTLNLLNYDLYNVYKGNTFKRRISLLGNAILLTRKLKELINIPLVFVGPDLKKRIREFRS